MVGIPGSVTGTGKDAMTSIESAIVAEKAASLGHAGHLLQKALAALNAAGDDPNREERVYAAAERAWAYLAQRELCGLRDQSQAVKDFAIPAEVMARVGARRPERKKQEGYR